MIEEAYLRRRRHIGRFSRNSGGTLGMRAAEQPPMSQVGQLRRIDNGAGGRGMSASPLKADMRELASICPFSAITGLEQMRQIEPLFDHLVG
jgi:hypothetical protein